jgi:hypothetical protein
MTDRILKAIDALQQAAYETGYLSSSIEHARKRIPDEDIAAQKRFIEARKRLKAVLIEEIDNAAADQSCATCCSWQRHPMCTSVAQRYGSCGLKWREDYERSADAWVDTREDFYCAAWEGDNASH